MTELKYKELLQEIENNYTASKRQLYIDYATSQRKFKVGDVIKNDNGVIIEVQKFGTSVSFSLPKPTYIGKALRKDLVPKKNGDIETIYGNDSVELVKGVGL